MLYKEKDYICVYQLKNKGVRFFGFPLTPLFYYLTNDSKYMIILSAKTDPLCSISLGVH